jgi:hypothetical protein
VLSAVSTCPATPPAAAAATRSGLPPAHYLVTAIVTLEATDGNAHAARCAIVGDGGVVLALSPSVLVGGDPVGQLAWSAIETVADGTVRVDCQVQSCGGVNPAAVRVLDARIAAVRSE